MEPPKSGKITRKSLIPSSPEARNRPCGAYFHKGIMDRICSGRPKPALRGMYPERRLVIHGVPDARNRTCGAGKLCDEHCPTRGIRIQVLGKCAGIYGIHAPPQAAREHFRVFRTLGSRKHTFPGVLGAGSQPMIINKECQKLIRQRYGDRLIN